MAQTQPKQNFHADSEAGINRQINVELYASYVYQSMVRISCLFIVSSTIVEKANFAKNVISPIEHSYRFFTCVTSQAHSEKGISKGKRKAVCQVVLAVRKCISKW